jgi:hypothetical protein
MSLFSTEDVLIENNLPAMVAPGSKTLVELVVNKGEVQGFSKLELNLPAGFVASPADIKGASFTFSGQKAKFVWMTLPSEENFKVTYYIESAEIAEGPYEITGTFSYVKMNKREDLNIPSKTIILKKGVVPAPEVAEMLPALKKEAMVVDMVCERTLEKVSDTEYIVTLRVINNKIQGFGKILENLPENCSSEKINDGGAVLTQDEHSIKFVWFEVPVAASFEVSYKLLCTSPISEPIINGQISYTEEGNPVTANIVQVAGFSEPLASNTPPADTTTEGNTENTTNNNTDNSSNNTADNSSQNNSDNNTTEISSTADNSSSNQNNNSSGYENKITEEMMKKDQPVASNNSGKIAVTSIPSAENGITYKVQILAAHRVVNKTFMKDKYNFNDQFNIENHEGWVKYTTGSFSQYKDARDARVKITSESSKLPGPFVTAYNDGERITVQEALLVSKQLWYK